MAVINLFDGLSGNDSGGTWSNGRCDGTETNSVNISDPTNVTIPDSPTATYYFSYTVGTTSCTDCTEVSVNIYDGTYTVGVAENIEVCTDELNSFDLESAIYNWTTPPDTDDIVPDWDLFVSLPSGSCPVYNGNTTFNLNLVGLGFSNIGAYDNLDLSNCNVGDVTNVILRGRWLFPDNTRCETEVPFTITVVDCLPCPDIIPYTRQELIAQNTPTIFDIFETETLDINLDDYFIFDSSCCSPVYTLNILNSGAQLFNYNVNGNILTVTTIPGTTTIETFNLDLDQIETPFTVNTNTIINQPFLSNDNLEVVASCNGVTTVPQSFSFNYTQCQTSELDVTLVNTNVDAIWNGSNIVINSITEDDFNIEFTAECVQNNNTSTSNIEGHPILIEYTGPSLAFGFSSNNTTGQPSVLDVNTVLTQDSDCLPTHIITSTVNCTAVIVGNVVTATPTASGGFTVNMESCCTCCVTPPCIEYQLNGLSN